jgi:hypothetical protein
MLAAIAAVCVVPSAKADGGGMSLDQLMAMLRSVPHMEARYVERRTLHALRTPIEMRGTLRFEAPDHLEKLSDPNAEGPGEQLTVNGNQLTVDLGKGRAPVMLMLNEHPEIGVLIDSIRATLSGDGAALRRSFDITLSGTIAHWQLVLQPRDARQREILQWMRVTGYDARITAIDTQDADGDHAEMSIVELAR